eukprot:scaffold59120_cov29-Phaeocystis_antarctica.AAC.1
MLPYPAPAPSPTPTVMASRGVAQQGAGRWRTARVVDAGVGLEQLRVPARGEVRVRGSGFELGPEVGRGVGLGSRCGFELLGILGGELGGRAVGAEAVHVGLVRVRGRVRVGLGSGLGLGFG